MKRILFGIGRVIGATGRATIALVGICGVVAALANYAVTQGAGTNFGSIVVSTVHYAQQLICDSVTPAQCVSVSAGGAAKVDGSAVTQPVSGTVTANAGTNLNTSALGTSANQTSELTKLDTLHTDLGTLNTTAGNPIPACAAAPCVTTVGNFGFDPSSGKGTPTEAFLALPATTTTQIIALNGVKVTYVTLAKVLAGGTVNVTFKYGTGSNCGTGTTTLEGPYPLTAQAGWVEGNGAGPVMIVPSGQALCITTDASVGGGAKLIFQQI